MSPLDGTGPVMLNMTFTSRFSGLQFDTTAARLGERLRTLPGMVAAEVVTDAASGTVTTACVFVGLLARERFVLSSLYDRLPGQAGMRVGTRTTRRVDLGTTDRDDLEELTRTCQVA